MHGVKKKKFRWFKVPKKKNEHGTAIMKGKMKSALAKAKAEGYRIIYLDETCFTRKTMLDMEWALPGENVTLDVAKINEPCLALLAAISKGKGLEHYRIFPKSVDTKKFKEWLRELRELNGDDKICLFMDNLSCHRSDKALNCMKELGFKYIFNLPYAPEYNPIELTFSLLKHKFKALRQQKLVGLRQEPHEALVKIAWESLRKGYIVNCIRHVEDLLK